MIERLRAGAVAGRLSPVATALALALIAVIPVSWSFGLKPWLPLDNAGYVTPPVDWRPIEPLSAIALALGTLVPAALVSSAVGAGIARRLRSTGLFITLALAWFISVSILPVVATLLGIHLRTAIGCLFSCESSINDGDLVSGLRTALLPLLGAFKLYVALVVPLFVAMVGKKRRSLALLVFGVVLGHAILYVIAFLPMVYGAHIPYGTLVVGFAIWAYVVRDHFAPWPPKPAPSPAGPAVWNAPDAE